MLQKTHIYERGLFLEQLNYHDTVYVVHLVVILIWRFGDFGFNYQT